jgi:hypothetical protein
MAKQAFAWPKRSVNIRTQAAEKDTEGNRCPLNAWATALHATLVFLTSIVEQATCFFDFVRRIVNATPWPKQPYLLL